MKIRQMEPHSLKDEISPTDLEVEKTEGNKVKAISPEGTSTPKSADEYDNLRQGLKRVIDSIKKQQPNPQKQSHSASRKLIVARYKKILDHIEGTSDIANNFDKIA